MSPHEHHEKKFYSAVHRIEVRPPHSRRIKSYLTITSLGQFSAVSEAQEEVKKHRRIREDPEAIVCLSSLAHIIQSKVAASRKLPTL